MVPRSIYTMSTTKTHLSILVHKGDPLDYQMYRHTTLLFQLDQNDAHAMLVEVVGPNGEFQFETREVANPHESPGLAKEVDVGCLPKSTTADCMVEILKTVPIENLDREFNCQVWVERALSTLRDLEYLSSEDYERAIDSMVDAIAERADDDD